MKLTIGIGLILFVIVAGPFVTIWSLNTLFPALAIPYAWDTWLASAALTSAIAARVKG